jgi:hypothetical protein
MAALTPVRIYGSNSWRLHAVPTVGAGLMLFAAGCKWFAPGGPVHASGGQVHGIVVAQFANVAASPAEQIALPDVSVYLKNTSNGKCPNQCPRTIHHAE